MHILYIYDNAWDTHHMDCCIAAELVQKQKLLQLIADTYLGH